jgi:hypothetical protein
MNRFHRPSPSGSSTAIARHLALVAIVSFGLHTPAFGQTLVPYGPGFGRTPGLRGPIFGQTLSPQLPPVAKTADLSGPRFGLTLLADGVVKKLEERDIFVSPHISQFGWQFEKQFYTRDSGVTMVTEWVGLVGGLEQSVVLPSLSWLVGVRTRDGAEFGIGPNVTPAGTALVLATGMTFRAGALNIPVNVAVVPSKAGSRVSVLSGFSLRHR